MGELEDLDFGMDPAFPKQVGELLAEYDSWTGKRRRSFELKEHITVLRVELSELDYKIK